MWDDATIWQDQILSRRLTAVLFWLFGNMFLLPRWSQEESGMLIFQCVLSNWPFLWQSISVIAVRMNCITQTERNKITAGRHLSSRRLIMSTPILSGWLFPKLPECPETSVTRKPCELGWDDFCAPRYWEISLHAAPKGSLPGCNLAQSLTWWRLPSLSSLWQQWHSLLSTVKTQLCGTFTGSPRSGTCAACRWVALPVLKTV